MCKADTNAKEAPTLDSPTAVEDTPLANEFSNKPDYAPAHTYGEDFHWVYTDEPHATRRKQILAKHPEVKKLFGHCPRTKYICLAVVALQTTLAYYAPSFSWPVFIAVAYIVGGTANHCMMMAMHELSHNLGFKRPLHNKILALFANLPIAVPSAISFKRYHMEHHKYQGEDGVDVDLPTPLEGRIFNNIPAKLFFVIFQVLFYSVRPMIVNPKKPGKWELYNYLVCFSYDAALIYFFSGWSLAYLLSSTLFGGGIHPVAGHFIAEHYEFILGIETYSYYGVLNRVTFNVGLHNEHHDFPFVPGSRLHQLNAMAPEFYDSLPQHESWTSVMIDYVMNPAIGAHSRIKRKQMDETARSKLKAE